jgi:hypothetical protein
MSNIGDVEMKFRYGVQKAVRGAFIEAVKEVFADTIVPMAKALGPEDTGYNNSTIEGKVRDQGAIGVTATLTTNSGYGGYIELGHRVRGDSGNMVEGTPYIYPAMIAGGPVIIERTKEYLAEIKG